MCTIIYLALNTLQEKKKKKKKKHWKKQNPLSTAGTDQSVSTKHQD